MEALQQNTKNANIPIENNIMEQTKFVQNTFSVNKKNTKQWTSLRIGKNMAPEQKRK